MCLAVFTLISADANGLFKNFSSIFAWTLIVRVLACVTCVYFVTASVAASQCLHSCRENL